MNIVDNISASKNLYIKPIKSDITVVKYIFSAGYSNTEYTSGYAHLIEHMIIQVNKEYLTGLEKKGIHFNAETKECTTEFYFIELEEGVLLKELENEILDKMFEKKLTSEALEIEKKTIIQEHMLLCEKLDESKVDNIIGNKKEIESFQLEIANEMKDTYYENCFKVVVTNIDRMQIATNKISVRDCNENWVNKISILKVIKNVDEMRFLLKKDQYAELLVYFLRILFNDVVRECSIDILDTDEEIEIVILGNKYDITEKVLRYKENAYVHYNILLSSLRFMCDEMSYIIVHKLYIFNLERLYKASEWEKFIYEKIVR